MGERLTLPGDIPGLLRRGSPVVVDVRKHNRRGVCVWHGDVGWLVTKGEGKPKDHLVCDLDLDLRDPTGQYHAALWLLEQDGADTRGGVSWRFWHGGRGAVLKIEGFEHAALFAGFSDAMSWEVPALADCKTAAEALRCAVLARAGREE